MIAKSSPCVTKGSHRGLLRDIPHVRFERQFEPSAADIDHLVDVVRRLLGDVGEGEPELLLPCQ